MAVLSVESLPLGFRFRPTDEELINHYLKLKINGRDSEVQVIPEVDVCKWEPWDLPGLAVIKTADPEWFFFCPRDRKYPNGHRSNRATDSGYWKATGKDRTIKSKKTMIGMKKTLVFYLGRAPKGKRTNWIMHEYRPTQQELDGTGPGQNPFVLFRLFHKPDDRTNGVKADEAEPTGYSPATSKSSPDDTSSDIVQESASSDVQVEKQADGAGRWFTDNVQSNPALSNGSYGNIFMASDVEDQTVDGTTIEDYPLHDEITALNRPARGPVDGKLFSGTQPNIDAAQYMDLPFASDFGDDNNEFQFQDGTCEQDVSLTDLLDEVLNNQDESFYEESIYQRNTALADGNLSSENPFNLQNITSITDTKMAQPQQFVPNLEASKWFDQIDSKEFLLPQNIYRSPDTQESLYGQLGQDAPSAYSAVQPFYNNFNSFEQPTISNDRMNHEGGLIGGAGIKIRSREPQHWANPDVVNQGTASRRIRLQVKKETSQGDAEYEVQSRAADIPEAADTVSRSGAGIKIRTRGTQNRVKPDEIAIQGDKDGEVEVEPTVNEHADKFSRQKPEMASRNLRLRQKHGEPRNHKEPPALPMEHQRSTSSSSKYIVVIFIVSMVLIGFVGVWSSLSS